MLSILAVLGGGGGILHEQKLESFSFSMDRVQDTPNHHLKYLVTSLKVKIIRGHEVKRSNFECKVFRDATETFFV